MHPNLMLGHTPLPLLVSILALSVLLFVLTRRRPK